MSTDGEQGPLASNDNGEGAPGPAVPAAPVAPVPETNEDVIKTWIKRIYIDYPHLGSSLAVTMENFVNIVATARTDPHHSWLEGHQLELAMALLTLVQKKRTDILFVPTSAGSLLARVGLCIDDKDQFKQEDLSKPMYEAMQQEEYRWIVVPVTDGMADERTAKRIIRWRAKAAKAKEQGETGEEEQVARRQEVSKEAEVLVTNKEGDPNGNTEVQQESEPEMTPSGGTHWGFMVIDKERNDARWLDGHLNVKQKRNKHWYIHNMHKPHPAWVAGKILCGYDKVMDLERGAFTAATLKHVPHDTKNNSYRGDEGSACGPWVYAMLKYILDNPRFLTDAGGLYSAFSSRYRRRHPQQMAFNSLQTRRDMQEIIRKEADKNLGENVLPYKMSVRVVQILGLPSTGQLCDAVASLNPNRRAPPGPGGNRSSGRRPGSDNDSSDGDDDGWPDEHDGVSRAQYQMYLQEGEPYSRNRLDEVVKAFKDNQDDIARNFQRKKHGVLTKNPEYKFPQGFSKDKLPAFDQLKMDSSEPWYTIYQNDLLKVDDSRSLALQTSRAVLHSVFKGSFKGENAAVLGDYVNDAHAFTFPERSQIWTSETIAERLDQTYLDLALPLFASLSNAGVDIWVKNLHPTAMKVVQDAVGVTRYDVARGLLCRMFIGEFEDMTDRDVDEWRASDPHMLDTGKQNREVARWWLTWYYYQGDAMEKLPYLAESPLHWPPREHREVHGQKRKRASDGVDEGDDANAGQPPSDPDNASNVAQPDPKTIQWATLDHATLMKHATKEIREDPRIGELSNDYTYRAILFVKHGGTFKHEKDRANTWIRDINVFTLGSEDQTPKRDVFPKEGVLVTRPTPKQILERMKKKYEKASSKPASSAKGGRKGPKVPPGSRVQDDDARPAGSTIIGGRIGGASVPAKKRKKVYYSRYGPDRLPDFATTSISLLDKFVKHNADLFADRDLSKLAKETQRAVMHRTYIGSFKEDSRQSWREVWYKDSHAFTEEEQNENWSWADIVQRMDDTYNNLELPPTFMSLSHAEIDIWLQNLPEVIRNRMKHRDGNVLYDRAPGILHRLFVGEFEELRAEGAQNSPKNIKLLADWREKDPEKYGSVTEAVNRLKFRFGSDDGGSMDLPFLRESPLHWPPRERLPASKGGLKRKPTSPVPGGDASKKSKIDWTSISDKGLAAYITNDIKNDASINSGRTPSHTTYRAILFVRDGGSFKDESEDRCRNLWIRDSNVFTRNDDWVVNEDGSVELVNVTWQQVRKAMQARYENTSASTKRSRGGEEDTRPSKRAKTDGVNWAYIASIIGNETPDFTRMPSTSVEKWVDALIKDFPAALGHRKSKGIWPYRAVLQHLYGSFDELTNDDKSHWLKYHPAFSGGKATIDDVTETLKNSVEDIGPLNVRGVLTSYPKSYLDRFAERHPEDPDSTQPAPDPDSVTKEGNLDYLSDSNGSDVEFDDEFDDELEDDNTE